MAHICTLKCAARTEQSRQSSELRKVPASIWKWESGTRGPWVRSGMRLKGAMVGAGIAGIVALAVPILLLGFVRLVFDVHPNDRADDLERLRLFLPLAALVGSFVGAIGGLAARLPRKGVRMLTSISIVAGCAALARLPIAAQPRYKGSPEPSYVPVILAALLGGVIVLTYGLNATKRATAADKPSPRRDV